MSWVGVFGFVGALAALAALVTFYKTTIEPRRTKSKLRHLFALIEDWFDEIDRDLEQGLSIALLNNKENKFRHYIEDSALSRYTMTFSPTFKREYLKSCGIKHELSGSDALFEEYSRCPSNGISLTSFVNCLVGAFYTFHKEYKAGKGNYADFEMGVKFFRYYVNNR